METYFTEEQMVDKLKKENEELTKENEKLRDEIVTLNTSKDFLLWEKEYLNEKAKLYYNILKRAYLEEGEEWNNL